MNKNRLTVPAVLALVVILFAWRNGGDAAEQHDDKAGSAIIARSEQLLRDAGASKAELAMFENWVSGISTDDLAKLGEYVQKDPSHVLKLLNRDIREEQAPAPHPVFDAALPVMSCDALRHLAIPDVTVDSTTIARSDGSCRVTATVIHPPADNHIKVFIALPSKSWNGRFMGTGGGGYAGGSIENLDAPARKGFAVGATDTGNPEGTANFAIGSNGQPAWQRMRDNAYLGIHDMTVVGKALAGAFYGKTPRYSYFVGGSTGGRQALTEAQRYPKDYDGILALYPAIARDRYVPAQVWPQILMNEAGDFLPRAKLQAATAAAVKACGSADGIVAGIIDDPVRCRYDPEELVGSKVGDGTFTATDARIIRSIWQGPRSHDGGFLWWGPTPGTDLSNFADTSGSPPTGRPCKEGLDWFRYFLLLDPQWDWRNLTRQQFELLFAQSIQEYAGTYGGDDPDLTGFRAHGGKLLIVHGWADQFVPAQKSVAYYQAVEHLMGGAGPTGEFLRLFLVPGANHGFSTSVPAPSNAAMRDALIQWVEQGRAPQQLLAELYSDRGALVQSRTLFPYADAPNSEAPLDPDSGSAGHWMPTHR
jgi:hypothetical protein